MNWWAFGVDIFNGLFMGFFIYRGLRWRRERNEAVENWVQLTSKHGRLLYDFNVMLMRREYEPEETITMQFSLSEE